MSKEIKCKYTREVVCPYCGYEFSDSWDFDLEGDGDEGETECGGCGEEFVFWMNLEVTYSSMKKE